MPVKTELQKLDLVNLDPIFKRRNDLNSLLVENDDVARAIGEHVDVLIPAMLDPYTNRLKVAKRVVEQSLYALLERKSDGHPTLKDCKKANWILASNVGTMREGHPAVPFTKIYKPEWTPAIMVDANEDVTYFGAAGHNYVFKSMAGYTATEEFDKFVPRKGGRRFVHVDMLGLPWTRLYYYYPKEKKLPIDAPMIYVGMYAWVLIAPGCEFDAAFERAQTSPAFTTHNRKLFNARHTACIMGYEYSCVQCPMGMGFCWRSTHAHNYESRECSSCRELSIFNTSEAEETVCIPCRKKEALNRKVWARAKRKGGHGNPDEAQGHQSTVLQPGEGSAGDLAQHPDEGGGLRGGSEVQHQQVAAAGSAGGPGARSDPMPASTAGYCAEDGQVGQP